MTERPAPSSATDGFFQKYPVVLPQYTSPKLQRLSKDSPTTSDDSVLDNILRLYLPHENVNGNDIPSVVDESLHKFAQTCLDPETLRLMVDCETDHPKLQLLTTFGERNDIDPLRTSEGWKGLKDIQTRAGVVAYGYHDAGNGGGGYNRRIHQFALTHLWGPSCASVSCPAAMTDGAAVLLRRHLNRMKSGNGSAISGQDPAALQKVLEEAYARLISFDPAYAWTSGQWMTERPGGSNVSDTETLAHLMSKGEIIADAEVHGGSEVDSFGMPLGPYMVNGFKWFSSATDANMVVLLAKTQKGLSAFYAPMRRERALRGSRQKLSVMNGVRVSRLKNKLGTKGLPTAELEIKGMRAWLLGEEGKGVKEISAILNLTRLWTAGGSMAYWSRGLAVARAYAKVRKIKDGLLCGNKSHLRWMAHETVKYRACAHLTFLGVALLGLSEQGWEKTVQGTRAERWLPKHKDRSEILLRLLTPIIKAQCSVWAVWGLRECMESLGGVGYCETNEGDGVMNLARLCRDAMVQPIWEGTTTVLSEDFARVIKGRDGPLALAALDSMIQSMFEEVKGSFQAEVHLLRQRWTELHEWLLTSSMERLLYDGREAMQKVQDIVSALLMLCDAFQAESNVERVVAYRWISSRFGSIHSKETTLEEQNNNDKRIFLGTSSAGEGFQQSKL